MPILINSSDDWDLRRRARRDVQRHNERIRDAVRQHIPDILSQEDIITGDGKRKVKIPVRGLELPRFRFSPSSGEHAGQGDDGTRSPTPQGKGRTVPGTIIGREGGAGDGKKAGDQPGVDYYETDITVDELVEIAFEELGLPNLQDKGRQTVTVKGFKCDTIRRIGPQANLDRKRTLVEAYKRNARLGQRSFTIDPIQDPRYKAWEEVSMPQRNAVVFALRDVSGSMGPNEVAICRTFYAWMVRFLRKCYTGVEVVFITCHTEAQEVSEDDFIHLGAGGGTKMASAYKLCLEIIEKRYNPSHWNIYPFLFSDGDDFSVNECIEPVKRLIEVSNLVGYGEITTYGYWDSHNYGAEPEYFAPLGTLYYKEFKGDPRFVMVSLNNVEGVWPALKAFMSKRHDGLK